MFSQKQGLNLLIFPELNRTRSRKQVIITRLSKNHRVLSKLYEEFEGAGDVSHFIYLLIWVLYHGASSFILFILLSR